MFLGYRAYHINYGFIHSDFSFGVGIPFFMNDKSGGWTNFFGTLNKTAELLKANNNVMFVKNDGTIELKTAYAAITPKSHVCKQRLGAQ